MRPDKIAVHYPHCTKRNPNGIGIASPKTLCGRETGEEFHTSERMTWHIFSIFPNEVNCSECKKLAKGTGLIRYENPCGGL